MLTTAEILAYLGNWLSPGELAEVLKKLLIVPEAWEYIHNPTFLEQILDGNAEENLLPASLASRVLESTNPDEVEESEDDYETQLSRLWQEHEQLSRTGRDLEDIAHLAKLLGQVVLTPIHPEIVSKLLENVETWSSPLACAWPVLENGNELLSSLIVQDSEKGLLLCVSVLFANYPYEEALPRLLDLSKSIPRYELLNILDSFQPQVLDRLSRLDQETQIIEDVTLSNSSPDTHLSHSILAHLNGEDDLASVYIDQAEEFTLQLEARLMDHRAEILESSGSNEMALDARQQALTLQSTPKRRADLALFHIQQGNFTDALQVLPSEPQTLVEKIAASTALKKAGEVDRAQVLMLSAVEEAQITPLTDYAWLTQLIDLLKEDGDITSAIKIARVRVSNFPGDSDVLVDLANILNCAGDATSGSNYASLAFALSPHSKMARQTLAACLQESGNPTEALAHWTALADENPVALSHVAQCALEAGFMDLAVDMSRNLLEHEPHSATGHVLLGRALAANGELEESKELLEKATHEFPDHADAWIALAECQEKNNDIEAAGRTLATAIQMIPENAELMHAYSIWLNQQGRQSEAVEAAQKAYQVKPKTYKYQVAYGDLLRELGHLDEALPILKAAVGQKPFHWKGLQAIARTHEAHMDATSASQVMLQLPDSAPGDVHLYAARMALHSARENEDQNSIRNGKHHLHQAKVKEYTDPTIHYLQGLVHELEGNFQEAKEGYQTSAKSFLHKDPELYLKAKLGIARAALEMDQISEATSTLEEARLRYPASIGVLTLLSKTYLQSGNEIEALKTIERALKIEPSNRFALKQIAHISSQLKTWAPAMHAFKKSVDLDPDNPEAWIDFAENALTVGNVAESRKALSQALQLDRENPHVLAYAAKVLHKMNRFSSARRLLQRAVEKNADSVHLLRQLAIAAEDSGDYEISRNAWERVCEIEPQDKHAMLKIAQAYWATNQRSIAIKHWERILKVEPDDISTMTALANAYMAQGNVDTGLVLFNKAIQANPGNIELALQAAQVALDVHDVDMAFNVLSDLIRLAPENTEVLLTLSDCLIHRKQPDQALEVLESVIVKEPFPVRWFALTTIASAMVGDLRRAQASFEQGSQLKAIDDMDILLLSKAAYMINRWSDALAILSRAEGNSDNLARMLAEVHIRIRAAEVDYIYKQAQAHNHAPPYSINNGDTINEIHRLLSKASHFPINKTRLESLTYRAKLLSSKDDPTHHLQKLTHAKLDRTGETLEAMALSRLRMDQPREALNLIALRDDYDLEGDLFDLIVGVCHIKLERFELARDVFQVAQEKPITRPLAQYFEAQTLFKNSKTEDMKNVLNAAITTWPEEYAWHYQLGLLYLEEGDLDAALPHLQQAAELAPENEEYNLALARVLRDTGHLSQAYARFKQAVNHAPTDVQTWYDAGSLALTMGDAESAETLFERACSLASSDPACLVGSARAAMALGNLKVAMEKVRTALRISPDDPQSLIAAGEIFAKQGKFDKAISSYELALSNTSDPVPVHLAQIRLLSQAGRAQEAVQQTSQFTQEFPEDEKIWAAHAEACEAANEMHQAQAAASKAVKLAPHSPTYRLILGRLSRKAGQLDRALDELSRLERIEPTNAQTLIELGQLYEDRRQLSDALDAYQRAISCDDQSTCAYYCAGLVLKQLKSYPEASAMLSKAVELDPNNPDTHHQLAAVRALELVHGGIPLAVVSI